MPRKKLPFVQKLASSLPRTTEVLRGGGFGGSFDVKTITHPHPQNKWYIPRAQYINRIIDDYNSMAQRYNNDIDKGLFTSYSLPSLPFYEGTAEYLDILNRKTDELRKNFQIVHEGLSIWEEEQRQKREKELEAYLAEQKRRENEDRLHQQKIRELEERIREQNRIEEKNRNEASAELPKILGVVIDNFSTKLKGKISKVKLKIEKELNKYSPSSLKAFLQNLTENERLKDKLILDSEKETEQILQQSYNRTHFNILLLGKTGVGKSTLINGIFNFSENEGAKTGEGKPITEGFEEFKSDKRKGLRIIDSKGIEFGEHNINVVFNSAKELIEKKAREGDPDKLIHCIWYCFKSNDLRFQDIEKEAVISLMNQYDDNSLPIILVVTQNYDDEVTKKMTEIIKKEFKFINREINILPVVAKEKTLLKKTHKFVIEKEGIEELIQITFEKSIKAIYPAFMKSIKEKIIQSFASNTENKKNKLKNGLKEVVQKILNEMTEEESIKGKISKLYTIIEKALNIFFEIPAISEKSKTQTTSFLDNLCSWCIGRLNDIISDLVKENANELSLELFNEQTKVKKSHNVEKNLSNEKSFDEFRIQSEADLKPSITNKVYFLAIKNIYKIISENLVEMSEELMKEEFNKIVPNLRKNISDEKIKQLMLQDIQNNH